MIKATSERSIDNADSMNYVLGIARGEEVTIGNGKVKWTLKGAYLNMAGGYSKERGVYPSAIARLRRKDKYGTVHFRDCHLHQVRLAN